MEDGKSAGFDAGEQRLLDGSIILSSCTQTKNEDMGVVANTATPMTRMFKEAMRLARRRRRWAERAQAALWVQEAALNN